MNILTYNSICCRRNTAPSRPSHWTPICTRADCSIRCSYCTRRARRRAVVCAPLTNHSLPLAEGSPVNSHLWTRACRRYARMWVWRSFCIAWRTSALWQCARERWTPNAARRLMRPVCRYCRRHYAVSSVAIRLTLCIAQRSTLWRISRHSNLTLSSTCRWAISRLINLNFNFKPFHI